MSPKPKTAPPPTPESAAESGTPAARGGRPRSEQAHRAILEAALRLVAETGYEAVSMDAVAAEAGVGKATIYRRWAGKEELILDALAGIVERITVPDTGNVRSDLLAAMRDAVAAYEGPAHPARVFPGLVSEMSRSPRLAGAVRGGFLAARREAVREVLRRGVARGELRADLDEDLALDFLAGPLYYRALVFGAAIDESLTVRVVDTLLTGIAAAPAGERADV